jgi:uncharacterized protein with von Willebrand factor type A (vWA) domain
MLVEFFQTIRQHGIPATPRELLDLMGALNARLISPSLDEFYRVAKLCLVKDERLFDRFDLAFSAWLGTLPVDAGTRELPASWFEQTLMRSLSEREREQLKALGWDSLMKALEDRLREQDAPHHGGSKWIGSGGTSPFGHGGLHPEGVRIGGPSRGNRGAVKVWEARDFRDYDDQHLLGTRHMQVALGRLRRFAREGSATELDLPDTIARTAKNAGFLDLRMVPERRNAVKIILLLDVGGSMDVHVQTVESLFGAARAQFRHMEVYYFHNCVYGHLWRSNRLRRTEVTPTTDLIRRLPKDHKLVFVGDATMSPYEVMQAHGAIDHDNAEPGAVWLQRLVKHFSSFVWLNPEPEGLWQYRQSIALIRHVLEERMFPMTLEGLTRAMRTLSRGRSLGRL